MKGCRTLPIAVGAAICAVVTSAGAQTPETPPEASVSSTNQQGGVTAWYVGTINYPQPSAADAKTRQLASALNLFRTNMMAGLRQTLGTAAYTYIADLPRHSSEPPNTDALYTIFVEQGLEPDAHPVCSVDEITTVGGFAAYLPRDSRSDAISVRMLGSEDRPMLQRICDGLRRPLSSLRRSSASGALDSELTVYDYLVRDNSVLIMQIMPSRIQGQDMSAVAARTFWAGALVGRYHRMPTGDELRADPELYEQMASLGAGGTVNLPLAAVGQTRAGQPSTDFYPAEARREFGDRIDTLDRDWVRFLANAAVTIRGRQVPLMQDDQPVPILRPFAADEIGGPEFWRASTDLTRTYEMIACIAGRFLSERYDLEASETDLGRCAVSEMTRSQ